MQFEMKAMRLLCVLGIAASSLAVLCSIAVGQAVPAGTVRNPQNPVPLHLLYRHFFAYQNHLDQIAAEDFQQGKDGSEFRDHYQTALGFTPAQFAPVRSAARRLAAELKVHDEKIKAVIDEYRAQNPRDASGRSEVPLPPAELGQLQQERDTIIKNAIARMNASLGPVRAAKLQSYIQQEVAQHAQVKPVRKPRLHDPAKHQLQPFPNGGQ
jgi:hypothetical protein